MNTDLPGVDSSPARMSGAGPIQYTDGLPERIGRYEVINLLGAGTCARVFACHDPLLERPVAVKVLHPDLPEELRKTSLDRFRVELRVFGRVTHPHVVGVFDACLEGEHPYLVMELCPGPTLEIWRRRSVVVPPGQAAFIFFQACQALDHIHALGIVHRDIKPANLVFQHRILKLADFGVAQAAFIRAADDGHLVGTPAYMAPEQFAGDVATPRSDLFSLAAVLYELLTGVGPLSGDPCTVLYQQGYDRIPAASTIAPDLPPDFDGFFAHALARDPDARFSSAAEMCNALSKIVPEHQLEEVEGIAGPVVGQAGPIRHYGYGRAPRAAHAYVSSRPMREPPPPEGDPSDRIGGAVRAPWARPKDRLSSPDLLEFNAPSSSGRAAWRAARPGAPPGTHRFRRGEDVPPGSAAAGSTQLPRLPGAVSRGGGLGPAPEGPPTDVVVDAAPVEPKSSPRLEALAGAPVRRSARRLWLGSSVAGALAAVSVWLLVGASGPIGHPAALTETSARDISSALKPVEVTTLKPADALEPPRTSAAPSVTVRPLATPLQPAVVDIQIAPNPRVAGISAHLVVAGEEWRSTGSSWTGPGQYRIELIRAEQPVEGTPAEGDELAARPSPGGEQTTTLTAGAGTPDAVHGIPDIAPSP